MFWRLFLLVLLGAVFLWLTKAWTFRSFVHYRIVGERGEVRPIPVSTFGSMDLDLAIDAALDTTAVRLHFSTGAVSNDPRKLGQGSPANCIGYAALCAALLKGQLETAGLGGRYVVEPVIGKLYVGDHDLHVLFKSPFWKDHDVVRIKDRETGAEVLIDPTLYDAIGVGRVRLFLE